MSPLVQIPARRGRCEVLEASLSLVCLPKVPISFGSMLQQVGIAGHGWWRYRIPGQGIVNWKEFLTVLLQIQFNGAVAVEHEDQVLGCAA